MKYQTIDEAREAARVTAEERRNAARMDEYMKYRYRPELSRARRAIIIEDGQ